MQLDIVSVDSMQSSIDINGNGLWKVDGYLSRRQPEKRLLNLLTVKTRTYVTIFVTYSNERVTFALEQDMKAHRWYQRYSSTLSLTLALYGGINVTTHSTLKPVPTLPR
jgi:hypothetical protein